LHRSAYFLLANGLYSLRVKTLKSTRDLQSSLIDEIQSTPFLIIMFAAIILSCVSLVAIFIYLWRVDRLKQKVLIIFTKIPQVAVQKMNTRSINFLE